MANKTAAAATFASALVGTTRNPAPRILLILITMPVLILFGGLVLHSLWNWFVTPLGPRLISYPEAVGLFLVPVFLRPSWGPLLKPEERDLWRIAQNTVAQIIVMTIFWAMAAVWHYLRFS